MMSEEKNVLSVKMFGQFSVMYNGVSLLGRRSGESQFITLMQLLLHNRKNGISREKAEEVLFGNRDVENSHHAMRSVVYNAKKRLETIVQYICKTSLEDESEQARRKSRFRFILILFFAVLVCMAPAILFRNTVLNVHIAVYIAGFVICFGIHKLLAAYTD